MKTSLSHIPEHKRDELISIVKMIMSVVKPEMIIFFGAHGESGFRFLRYFPARKEKRETVIRTIEKSICGFAVQQKIQNHQKGTGIPCGTRKEAAKVGA